MNKFLKGGLPKAFTLIELLGVLIVLAVISLITFPIIDESIKSSRTEAYNRAVDSIIQAAKSYSATNDLGTSTDKQALYLEDIQLAGLLEQTIINPKTKEEMSGCVWYRWNPVFHQYNFEYDDECDTGNVETEPTIDITYNESLINSNGWAKENIAVTLVGVGNIKYCISNEECEPNDLVTTGSNTKFIANEGTNYICAISSNSLGTTEKKCVTIKLDKTAPNIEGIEDLIVDLNDNVDLTVDVDYDDALSGIDGTLIVTPTSVDTSTTGTKQVTYKVQDMAGNIREVVRNIIVDAEAPSIVFNLVDSSAINNNNWANKDFYVRATITDNSGTGIKSGSSCTTNSSSECAPSATFTGTTKDFLISVEGTNRACIQVTDNNNKTSKVCSDAYNLDKTAPVAGTATFTGTLGSNSWYTTNVTVNVSNGSDALSGHNNTTSNVLSITSNTTGQNVTITTTDLAGNSSTRNYTIKLDKNAPTLTAKSGTVQIIAGDNNSVSNYFDVSYGISGGNLVCTPTNTRDLVAGNRTVSCTATGGNGKSTTASKAITVKSPYSFATDSWATIASVVRQGLAESAYNVGDTKEVNVSGYGTFTVRIANNSTPSECNTSGFSETACGFVVEFTESIEYYNMNYNRTSAGGWPGSEAYTFVQNTIYNALPSDLRNVIIDTKVISSHNNGTSANYITTDKLYLPSSKEIYGKKGTTIITDDSSDNYTRQLDYYEINNVTTDNYSKAIKTDTDGSSTVYWLRSASSSTNYSFYGVYFSGGYNDYSSVNTNGIAPAFRIG